MATNAAIELLAPDAATGPDTECTADTKAPTDMAAVSNSEHTEDEVAADLTIKTRRQRQKKFKAISSLLALVSVGFFLACIGLGGLAQ